MLSWRGYIRFGVSFFGGCLSVLVIAANAEQKIKETPMVVEAVPGEAIIAVASGRETEVLNDGSVVSLSNDQTSLIVQKNGREVRRIALLQQVDISMAKANSVLVTSYSGNSRTAILVHVPSGRRTELPGYDGGLSSYENLTYAQVGAKYLVFDFVNGKIQEFNSNLSGDALEVSNLSYGGFGSIFQLKGARTLLSVDQNLKTRAIALKQNRQFKSCRILSADYLTCEENESTKWLISVRGGELRIDGDFNILAKHSSKNLVLAQSRGSSLRFFAIDTTSKNRRELVFADTGIGSILSSRQVLEVFPTSSNPIALIQSRTALSQKTTYELRAYSPQEIDNILESEQSIDAVWSTGQRLYQSQDWNVAVSWINARGVEGGWTLESMPGNAVRIFHSRRPDEARFVYLGSDVSARKLGESGFALVTSYNSNSFTTSLMDLHSGRLFMLEAGYGRGPEYSEEHQTVVSSGRYIKMAYSLPLLRMASRSPLRLGVADRPNQIELGSSVLQMCTLDAGAAKDEVVDRLLELRQLGAPVSQDDMRRLLTYRLGANERGLVAQIFQRLLMEDPTMAELMFHKFQLYDRLEGLSDKMQMNPCFDDYLNKAIQAKLQEALKFKDEDGYPRPVSFTQLQPLLVFAPYFKKFGLDSQTNKEQLGERLATGAQNHPMASGIFYSKLYYFAAAAIEPLFGQKRTFKTDITVLVDGSNIVSHLLTTYPTTKTRSVRSAFGFYMTTLERTQLPENTRAGQTFTHSVFWDSRGRGFRADVKISALSEIRDVVPAEASVDHAALRKNGKLTGLVVIGTNLGDKHTKRSLNQYRFYYSMRGYKFTSTNQTIDNFSEWFRTQVESGELDYFVKEAHSDGDEKNLFRAARKVQIMTGKLAAANGKSEEVIYLVAPIYDSNEDTGTSDLLSNQLFGEWIRQREASGAGPIVYINASCSSYYKAIREISATRSRNLIMIPSITAVSMFTSRANNATGVLLAGIMDGKDWATIRTNMDESREVKERKNNVFALPPDREYEEYVRKALGVTVDSQVEIFDRSSGLPVHIDEFNSH